jgi:hypothetical protein
VVGQVDRWPEAFALIGDSASNPDRDGCPMRAGHLCCDVRRVMVQPSDLKLAGPEVIDDTAELTSTLFDGLSHIDRRFLDALPGAWLS